MHTTANMSLCPPITPASPCTRAKKRPAESSPLIKTIIHIRPSPHSLPFSPATVKIKPTDALSARDTERTAAASRIQSGWRAWLARIAAAKKQATPGERYVRTTAYPKVLSDDAKKATPDEKQATLDAKQATPGERYVRTTAYSKVLSPDAMRRNKTREWGMINFTPITGGGQTLSVYKIHREDMIGEGAEAVVFDAPRGFVERIIQSGGALTAAKVDPARYADLTSFMCAVSVDDKRQIARHAGTNLSYYLYKEKNVLTVADFQHVSEDLKALHQRGLYHLDIKLANMTFAHRKQKNEPDRIFIIDCDGITDRPNNACYGTFFRCVLAPDANADIPVTGRADDEYAFLLMLIQIADSAFAPVYRQLGRKARHASMELLEKLHQYLQSFVEKYIKPAFRQNVYTFISSPTDNNRLPQPLHDMIDWSAPPDLISALRHGNPMAIQTIGQRALDAATTREQRRDLLIAKNADWYPGLYWPLKRNDIEAQYAWETLIRQLPDDEQNEIMNEIDTLLTAKIQ